MPKWSKIYRCVSGWGSAFTAVDSLGAIVTVALSVEGLAALADKAARGMELIQSAPVLIIALSIFGLAVILFRTHAEYKRRTYDPTWALEFDKIFQDIKSDRAKAARVLAEHFNNLNRTDAVLVDIDEVLDFIDTLAFYVRGGQISLEVSHQHFHHWVFSYYQIASPYIAAWRAEKPARWEHIKWLYDGMEKIEIEITDDKHPRNLTDDEKRQFLDEERQLSRG